MADRVPTVKPNGIFPSYIPYQGVYIEAQGMRLRLEPRNRRIKILTLDSGEELEKSVHEALAKATLFSQQIGEPIKVMTRVPRYNGIEKVLLNCSHLEYYGVIEEKEAIGHFIDENGKVWDGLTIAWIHEDEFKSAWHRHFSQ